MPRSASAVLLLAAALALALATARADAADLYGVSGPSDGVAFIVTVNTSTGVASGVFSFPVPAGFGIGPLAYHASSGLFVVISSDVGGSPPTQLILVDPVTETASSVMLTGLPPGSEKTSGLEYRADTDELLITFGETGGSEESRIARVGLDGVVQATSTDVGLGDIDVIGWDGSTGNLLACDFNAIDGLPPVAAVFDVFTIPSFVGVANPPFNNTVGDVAIDPMSGRFFMAGLGGIGGLLVELVGDSYVTIGTFNTGLPIIGLAFVPPDCPADLDGSSIVDINDLLELLSQWGPCPGCAADFDGSGTVDISDLLDLLAAWGACP
jgi:hypothetical protein